MAVAMGGVWVTSEATALINATFTAVAGVHVSVWRKRSGATDFFLARGCEFFVAGEVRDGLIGGCSAGGRRACGARPPTTDSGV